MDSTMVHQIVAGATQLGMGAKEAFIWWLAYKLASDLLGGAVAIVILWRVTAMARLIGEGQRMVCTVSESTGRTFPQSSDFAQANRILRDKWSGQ